MCSNPGAAVSVSPRYTRKPTGNTKTHEHAVTGNAFWTAQAAVADRTAQVAGANAAGGDESLSGMLGTAILRAGNAVNVAGTVAASLRAGKVRAYTSDEVARAKNLVVVDVDGKRGQGAAAIPFEEIRGRLKELQRLAEKGALVFRSETGRRGYLAARIAEGSGIACGFLSGGTR
jgi:hypothetical protein